MQNPNIEVPLILEVMFGTATFLITASLSVIAFFISKYFKKIDDNEVHIGKRVGKLENDLSMQQAVIKSNRELLETSIELQNAFLRNQLKDLKETMDAGFAEIKREMKK